VTRHPGELTSTKPATAPGDLSGYRGIAPTITPTKEDIMLQNTAEITATADTQPDKPPALLDPGSPIEVPLGSGSTNDPGPDIRPPAMAGDDVPA
jgi:hypothetical protein